MKLDWLKHAFAVEKAEDFAPTDEQKQVSEKICRWIAKRGMTMPTIMALEASRGLNYIGSQALHFFRPAVSALLDTREYAQFADMLEHRGSIDYLCRLLEESEKQFTTEAQRAQREDLEEREHDGGEA